MSLLTGCAVNKAWTLQAGQHPQAFARTVTIKATGQLLLYLPRGFGADRHARYPLVVFLHGSGEAGAQIDKVSVNGPPKLVAAGRDLPFILASPQSPGDVERFDPVVLNAMLDELMERLPIDPDRVYLTGLSMGGMWTYGWASLRPERFAAIAPVCGDWDPADACRFKHIPVWAFHGAKDDVVPVAGDQTMVDAIKACGGEARLTVYADLGHDSWTRAYEEPQLFPWLLAQRRQPQTSGSK